jgi:hypothetical protein
MTSKKLGALLRSVPPAVARVEAPDPPPADTPSAPAVEPPAPRRVAQPAAIEPEVPLQVLVPRHIHRKLAVKAAEEGPSLRGLVLRAIRSLGIEVTDDEIRGKRGRKNA